MQKKYEICLRLSKEERARLESSARRCGLSKTAYAQAERSGFSKGFQPERPCGGELCTHDAPY